MDKKRIVVVNDYISGGGVENVLYNLLHYLYERKYDITVLTFYGNKEEFYRLYPLNIKYISCNTYAKYYDKISIKQIIHKIYRIFYEFIWKIRKYDIAIALKEGPCTKFVSNFNAKKKYTWVHADYNLTYWTKGTFKTTQKEKEYMQMYDKVVCVSETVKRSVCQVLGNPGNLVVKFNPIDVDYITKNASGNNDMLQRTDSKKTILVSVGRLCGQKGYMRLLECCSQLNQYYDFELWIVGGGPDKSKMEDYIYSNGLKNVILWGEQENPYPFIKKANWFVTSTFGESYGLAVQEALILGVPVLATICPAFEEVVSKEQAILVENTEEGLYGGLELILKNSELLSRYQKRNCDTYTHEYMYTKRLEEIEKLWL